MRLKIAILGCRGIPNHYGGFEQFAEFLAKGLVENGHQVTVYNSHKHPYQANNWKGVNIVKRFDPEFMLGTVGQFIYDLNCIRHSNKQGFDIILMLGYTSSSVWFPFFPKSSLIFFNMDGLEWKRSKYAKPVQKFLLFAEKLAVKHADQCIADSLAIKTYLDQKYRIDARFISYGAEIHNVPDSAMINSFGLKPKEYMLLIARMEPENNIESILEGFRMSGTKMKLMVVGNTGNNFANKMINKFANVSNIIFIGALYDMDKLNALRYYCYLYFHGHSVGGTNPSLLEAMASEALICAHDNLFNRSVLGTDSFYFSNALQIRLAIENAMTDHEKMLWIQNNKVKIINEHSWDCIISSYENLFSDKLISIV